MLSKIFSTIQDEGNALRCRPLPGGVGRPKLISWRRSLTSPTDPVSWGSMRAIPSYPHPQTGPITIHCTAA